jgi:hypothetical protein
VVDAGDEGRAVHPVGPRTPSRRRVKERSPSRENHRATAARGGPCTAT